MAQGKPDSRQIVVELAVPVADLLELVAEATDHTVQAEIDLAIVAHLESRLRDERVAGHVLTRTREAVSLTADVRDQIRDELRKRGVEPSDDRD